jgi:REP element-mobilizing transposase RayT
MARPLRIEYKGAFYHITARGNEKKAIFKDDRDRKKFLSLLEISHHRYNALICAYCLMNNHYHIILETPLGNLSTILHHINAGYTNYYNRRHNRVGHLFQGRYKAILVDKDAYILELSRYIHLNPVRSGIVRKPEEYIWSSYKFYIDKVKVASYLNKEMILSYSGKDAEDKYRKFVEEGLKKKIKNPFKKVVSSTILGEDKFIEWVRDNFIKSRKKIRDLPTYNFLIRKPTLEEIDKKVSKIIKDKKKGRKISLYIMHKFSGAKLKDIGKLFNISESGVTQNTKRFEKDLNKDRGLRKTVDVIQKELEIMSNV